MDLYPYLNFFQDYQYEQGYYPPLNDLDLIMDINSEKDKSMIAYTLLGEIESTFSDEVKIGRMYQNISKFTGLFLDYEFFVSVIKKMTFTLMFVKKLTFYKVRSIG